MQIDVNEIKRITPNDRNYALGIQYYNKRCIKTMTITFDEVERVYTIEAYVNRFQYENRCTIAVNEGGTIVQYGCDCAFCSQHSACAHIVATLFLIREQEPRIFPFYYDVNRLSNYQHQQEHYAQLAFQEEQEKERQLQYETEKKRQLEFYELLKQKRLEELRKQRQEKSKQLIEFEKERLLHCIPMISTGNYHIHITFEAVQNKYYDVENSLSISMRVGNRKMYVVNNFSDFFHAYEHHELLQYGKGLSFIHSEDAFDMESQGLLHILYNNYKAHYDFVRCGRRLDVYGNYLDDLFDACSEYEDLSCASVDYQITIQVEKKEDFYCVSLVSPKRLTKLMRGDVHFYTLENGTLTRKALDSNGIVMRLFRELESEVLYITMEDIYSFCEYVVEPCKQHIIIKGKSVLPEITKETLIQLYADIDEEGMVHMTLDCYFDDVLVPGFMKHPPLTSSSIALVENYIQHYADCIDYDAHCAKLNGEKEETILFLQDGLTQLANYCEIFVSDALNRKNHLNTLDVQVGVKIENDLLKIDINSIDISSSEIQEVLKAYRKKKKFYRLKNGDLINLDNDELQEVDQLMEDMNVSYYDLHEGNIELPAYRGFYMQDAMNQNHAITFRKEQSYEAFMQGFQDAQKECILPSTYTDVLRDYQKIGFAWLKRLQAFHFNGILADDMGLGKTLQVIALLDSEQQVQRTSIVIVPSSLILNWKDEIAKFSKSLKSCCVMGNAQQRKECISSYQAYDILVTSYDYIRRDIEEYIDKQFHYVILDEAQYIKNQKTKNATCVKQLHATHKLALTGTPIENSLAELWSIFDFLMPGYLYNYHYFQTHFEKDIVYAHSDEKQHALKKMVEPFILRRNKRDVLKELPEKIESTLTLSFTQEEHKLYLAHLSKVNKELQAKLELEKLSKPIILSMLTRLRQICCEPRILFDNVDEVGSKMKGCMELIASLRENHQRVLLFSSFTSVLDLLAQELTKAHIRYLMLTGQTDKKERHELVQKFQKGIGDVFLISLKAGGTGLNLTAAQAVIHYDPWWNASAQNQATDRAHRIGQSEKVSVYKLIMDDSIEKKIQELQEKKKNLADAFVEGNDGVIATMTMDEIMDLFK